MKKYKSICLIIIIFFFLIQQSAAQKINYDPGQLTRPYQFNENQQFEFALQSIMQRYSVSFIYYKNIMDKEYEFFKEQNNYYIQILGKENKSKKYIDKIKLERKTLKNGVQFLEVSQSELNRLIILENTNKQVSFSNVNSGNFIVERRGILYDREILRFSELYDYGKILDREFCLKYLKYTESFDPSPLFAYCVDGLIIPYMTPTGKQSGKVLFVDKGWNVIKFGERDSLANGVKTYGGLGHGANNLAAPTGIDVGRYWESGGNKIYPLYISDQNNNRLVKVDFYLNNTSGYSYFNEGSFSVLDSTLAGVFDVAYWESSDSGGTDDKIWISELDGGHTTLTSLDKAGGTVQKVRGFRNPSDNQDYLFLVGTEPRLSTYEFGVYNTLVFVDNMRNLVVPCPLDSTGNAILHSIGGGDYVIQAEEVIVFPENYRINSVNVHKTSPLTYDWPYLWVTTGFSPPFDNTASMIHLFKMNKNSRWQYLASTNRPENTDHTFSGLLNQVTVNDYYDVFSIEQWSDTHGLRRFMPFTDIRDDVASNYCEDSLDFLKWEAVFTNDCFVKLTAQRENGTNNWETVEIESVDFTNYNANEVIFYREAGWTQDPIIIKLDLPFKDYVLGNRVRINAKLYPEYDPLGEHIYKEASYTVDMERSCLPKPGGCPFLYVRDENFEYTVDNNLLHKSEFSGSENDIVDKYRIQVQPGFDHSTMEVYIVENENDLAYIDEVKMIAVDYPNDKKMDVTEDNKIVIYDSVSVIQSDSVLKNTTNITNDVRYHNPSIFPTAGSNSDSLYAHFPDPDSYMAKGQSRKNVGSIEKRAISNVTGRSGPDINYPIAFISNLSNIQHPINAPKDTAGSLTAISYLSNSVTKMFSRRELPSVVILPLFNDSNKIQQVSVKWQSDYRMKYLGVATLTYNGHAETVMPLSSAVRISASSDSVITSVLETTDENYEEVSVENFIKLRFDGSKLPAPAEEYKREYVIQVTGRYINGDTASFLRSGFIIPTEYSLSQNYPNPFNPITKINYELPKNSHVTLIIYDILGREVTRLANNQLMQAGRHTVEFNAQNYASGVYFYRIEAGTFVQAKKMVLVK